MDQQDGFPANLFKWDLRGSSLTAAAAASTPLPPYRILEATPPPAASYGGLMTHHHHQLHMQSSSSTTVRVAPPQNQSTMSLNLTHQLGGLEELFQPYGIRYYTASKIAELGFTVNTLVDMKEEELDDMFNSLTHIFRWDLLVGERYGIKAAVRAERRRLQELEYSRTHSLNTIMSADTTSAHPLDAFSQKAMSEERMNNPQQGNDKEAVGSGGGAWEMVAIQQQQLQQQHQQERKKQKQQVRRKKSSNVNEFEDGEEEEEDDELEDGSRGGGSSSISERQREHPFIVTEPGEVARGKKNGLDYLFHLYELCRDFLIQVQNLAKDSGDKCPTKVTNQVFRYAKKAGATYINKPKMRHYVHCYALHCLDEETSNALRKAYKERGENVGAWRQACYKPLVSIAGGQGWDIDAIFNAHPRLCIWYVPTKLRQLCHAERSAAAATTASRSTAAAAAAHHLPF